MNIEIQATNGARCANERHRFRIGADSSQATEFEASAAEFPDHLTNAMLDHGLAKRPGGYWHYLQVWAGIAKWRNVQNPRTGGVIAITHDIVSKPETAATLFQWACNSVQMARDIKTLTSGLAEAATNPSDS